MAKRHKIEENEQKRAAAPAKASNNKKQQQQPQKKQRTSGPEPRATRYTIVQAKIALMNWISSALCDDAPPRRYSYVNPGVFEALCKRMCDRPNTRNLATLLNRWGVHCTAWTLNISTMHPLD